MATRTSIENDSRAVEPEVAHEHADTPTASAASQEPQRPQVVIIGGGFAGLAAARQLASAAVDVTLIDRTNHHLFQPLLYQVATAALAPSDISAPIRYLLRNQKNTQVILGGVTNIDVKQQTVTIEDGERTFPYDYLLVATGARHSYFGKPEWEEFAPGLKSISDALEIRQRFLMAFEEAEKSTDPAERAAYQTFVVIGGGPTGCEMAGAIPEIAKKALHQDFRNIDTADTKVILLEGGKRILPTFPEKVSDIAVKELTDLGVDVRTSAMVVDLKPGEVFLKSGERIAAKTIVWGAGNQASPLAKMLDAPLDRAGRVMVAPDMSVPGHPEIFVAGDLAAVEVVKKHKDQDHSGGTQYVPWVAQGAIQGGTAAGRNILHKLYREPTDDFSYFDKGNMAVIGRNKAVADLHFFQIGGFIAWAMWLFIHILYLVGFRNRLSVLIQWAYNYLTYQRGVRLISDPDAEEKAGRPEAQMKTAAAAQSQNVDGKASGNPPSVNKPVENKPVESAPQEQKQPALAR